MGRAQSQLALSAGNHEADDPRLVAALINLQEEVSAVAKETRLLRVGDAQCRQFADSFACFCRCCHLPNPSAQFAARSDEGTDEGTATIDIWGVVMNLQEPS